MGNLEGRNGLANAPHHQATRLQWVLGPDSGGSSALQPLHPLSDTPGAAGSGHTRQRTTNFYRPRDRRQSPDDHHPESISQLKLSSSTEKQPRKKNRTMAPLSDDEWADLAAHELPKTSDPVVQKYLESRRALMAEEQKHRSGIAILCSCLSGFLPRTNYHRLFELDT